MALDKGILKLLQVVCSFSENIPLSKKGDWNEEKIVSGCGIEPRHGRADPGG
jgi:hypothetical protein